MLQGRGCNLLRYSCRNYEEPRLQGTKNKFISETCRSCHVSIETTFQNYI